MPQLLDLPDELLSHLASCLTAFDLIRLQQVSSRLHDIIKSSTALQYVIDSEVAGMVDNPASCLVPAERLRILRAKEKAWRILDLSDKKTIPLQHHPSGIYDLTGGVLLLGERIHTDNHTGTDKVRTVPLHSAFREDATPLWSTINLGKQVIDVGLAIQEHDLIAIVTYSYVEEAHLWASIDIHLVQHSTGQPHPAAQRPVLHYDNIHYLPGHCGIMLEVSGDTLCFMLNNYFPFVSADPVTLVIFNWKTGHPKVGQKRLYSDPTMFNSFILLSPDTVALPIVPTNSIEICHFTKELAAPPPPPALSEGPQPPPDVPLLQTTCILELPDLMAGAIVLRMTSRCEPNPRGTPLSATHADPRIPFHSDPDKAVMILHMHIRLPMGATHVYTMIVHRSSLLKLFQPALESQRSKPPAPPDTARPLRIPQELLEHDSIEDLEEPAHHHQPPDGPRISLLPPLPTDELEDEADEPVTIPWADWGPALTRWFFEEHAGTRWITTTCGQRFVRVRTDGRLHVYDFNVLALRRYMHERMLAGEPVGSRAGESVVLAHEQEREHPQVDAPGEEEGSDDEDEEEGQAEEGEGDSSAFGTEGSEQLGNAPESTTDATRRVRVVLGKTVFEDSLAWVNPVESSLPFIETSVRIADVFPSALIDEDIIVGLKMDQNRRHIQEVVLHRIGEPVYR